jgi:chaperonin cofactor prefoldin
MNNQNSYRMLDERVDRLEKQVKRLEKKVAMLESNNYPTAIPYNQNNYNPNNYSM